MSEDNLSDTVREYKDFINRHPKLRTEIRKSGSSWQEHYEKWVLLGENDPVWEKYKNDNSTKSHESMGGKHSEVMGQLMNMTKNIDIDKVQNQVYELNNTISMIQELLNGFVKSKQTKSNTDNQNQLFNVFRD